MELFLLTFIPLFVAIDPFGIIPLYLALTEGMTPGERKRIILITMATALGGALAFLFLGKGIFVFLGISVEDFKIAGGIILLLIALNMVLTGKEGKYSWDRNAGVVPLGVPLIVGPAMITTLIMQIDTYPIWMVLISLFVNLGIVALVFIYSRHIARLFGPGGMVALSKIIGLFLAAIAIMMIRVGIQKAFGL